MAHQRRRQGGFRFSFPWVASQATPQPLLPPQAPVINAQSIPSQGLSPHLATSQNLNQQQISPPRAQQSKDTETQTASPSRASTHSRVINSKPPLPSRISSQSRNTTKPPSPSQTSTQSRMPTQPPSQSPIQRKPRTVTQLPTPPQVNSRTRASPQALSPSRTMPDRADTKQSLQAIPKNQSPPTLVTRSNTEPIDHPSTSPISYKNETNLIGPKPEVEGNHDKVKQSTDEKSEDTLKDKDSVLEQKTITQTKDTDVSLSSGLKETILEHDDLTSDKEQKQVEEEKVVSITATLNPTSSTKDHPKTVFSDLAGGDRVRVLHHTNTTSSQTSPLHEGIKDDISEFGHKVTNERQKLPLDENRVSVITLTGENIGASMTLGHESGHREGKINIRRGYKVNPHESSDSTTEGEKGSNEEKTDVARGQVDENPKAYTNSNVQSINNSIMFNSWMADRNPGVHYNLSHNIMGHVDETKCMEPVEAHKTKFNITRPQKLSYKPKVRRRCLKGLFMESSDSDLENSDKPRRHGCRWEKSSKNKVEVL